MAAISWKNINPVGFGPSNRLAVEAGRQIQNSIAGFGKQLTDQAATNRQRATDDLKLKLSNLRNLDTYGSDSDALLAGVDPSKINLGALVDYRNTQQGNLQDSEQSNYDRTTGRKMTAEELDIKRKTANSLSKLRGLRGEDIQAGLNQDARDISLQNKNQQSYNNALATVDKYKNNPEEGLKFWVRQGGDPRAYSQAQNDYLNMGESYPGQREFEAKEKIKQDNKAVAKGSGKSGGSRTGISKEANALLSNDANLAEGGLWNALDFRGKSKEAQDAMRLKYKFIPQVEIDNILNDSELGVVKNGKINYDLLIPALDKLKLAVDAKRAEANK